MHPEVETRYGRLSGLRQSAVLSFRGIPYAAPPTGALRFRAPVVPPPWAGVRAAQSFGAPASQLPHPLAQLGASSEDCLFLNVWTPALTGKRPVMVFVHGGGYTFGASHEATYDGSALAERGDVVVVTLNYRLSLFGFLCLSELLPQHDTVSNAGLLDVLAALAWVRSEIAAFGGDPDCITLFGESAGACTVSALLGMTRARGTFQRAISQSGGLRVTSEEFASALAHELVERLGLGQAPERLWELPSEALLAASAQLSTRGVWGISTRNVSPFRPSFRFGPIANHDGVPGDLAGQVRAGANPVPLIVGTNRHEWTFFSQLWPEFGWGDEAHTRLQLQAAFGAHSDALIAAYRSAPSQLGDQLSDVADAIMGDAVFGMPSQALADAQSAHSPTFRYLLDYRSPRRGGKLGACHVIDLPLVFRTLSSPTGHYFAGDTPSSRAISERISSSWLQFARSGVPADGWPRYDAAQRATLQLSAAERVLQDPLAHARDAWADTGLFEHEGTSAS